MFDQKLHSNSSLSELRGCVSARGSHIDTGIYGSSLLVLLKDFFMAEFVQVKRTFDDKLKVVELAGANKRLS